MGWRSFAGSCGCGSTDSLPRAIRRAYLPWAAHRRAQWEQPKIRRFEARGITGVVGIARATSGREFPEAAGPELKQIRIGIRIKIRKLGRTKTIRSDGTAPSLPNPNLNPNLN